MDVKESTLDYSLNNGSRGYIYIYKWNEPMVQLITFWMCLKKRFMFLSYKLMDCSRTAVVKVCSKTIVKATKLRTTNKSVADSKGLVLRASAEFDDSYCSQVYYPIQHKLTMHSTLEPIGYTKRLIGSSAWITPLKGSTRCNLKLEDEKIYVPFWHVTSFAPLSRGVCVYLIVVKR